MTEENAGTAEITDEREQLIADLLEEAHGLRMKYEEFSYYTETKVAEFGISMGKARSLTVIAGLVPATHERHDRA